MIFHFACPFVSSCQMHDFEWGLIVERSLVRPVSAIVVMDARRMRHRFAERFQ